MIASDDAAITQGFSRDFRGIFEGDELWNRWTKKKAMRHSLHNWRKPNPGEISTPSMEPCIINFIIRWSILWSEYFSVRGCLNPAWAIVDNWNRFLAETPKPVWKNQIWAKPKILLKWICLAVIVYIRRKRLFLPSSSVSAPYLSQKSRVMLGQFLPKQPLSAKIYVSAEYRNW